MTPAIMSRFDLFFVVVDECMNSLTTTSRVTSPLSSGTHTAVACHDGVLFSAGCCSNVTWFCLMADATAREARAV